MESEESRKLKESSTVSEARKGILLYEPQKLSGSSLPSKDVGIKSTLGKSRTFSKPGNEMQSGENVSIKDLNPLVMLKLCNKLDIVQSLSADYRYLAAHFDMPNDHLMRISQGQNKTREVLKWIGENPRNTVAKLKERLVVMRRYDCVEIINEKYLCGEWEHRMGTSHEDVSGNRSHSGNNLNSTDKMFLPQHDMQDALSKTFSQGKKKNNRISLLLIGQDRVGKTSLKKSLLGEAIDENEASTVGIDFDVVEVKEENKSQPWKLAEDRQFIASDVYTESVVGKHVAKELAENQNLTERESSDGNETGSTIGRSQNRAAARNSVGENDEDPVVNDSRSQKNAADSFMTDDFKRKVQKEMANVQNYRDDSMDTIRFNVGDVAGHSVYYDAHSIMLRLRTLFLLVVDLSRPLTYQAHPKFVEKETKIEQDLPNRLKETNLDYVTRWMAAVRNLKPCSEEPSPKIILVLTKPDELSGSEEEKQKQIEKVIDILEKRFELIECETIATFVIRNKGRRSDDEEKELKELREKIFKTAQDLLKGQERTPVSWLMLERALDIRRKEEDLEHRPYITLDEVRRLDKEFSMVDETFEEAMEFLHEENIVVHISEDPDLKNLVVLDATWLVKLFTNVLTVPKVRSWCSTNRQAWKALRDKGELQFDKLPNPLADHSQKEALKLMMVNAGLICHKQGDTYLVPSMVTKRKEENEICECLKSCLQPSLFLDFKEETIPLAFYTRFQVELLKAVDQDEIELYCNFMSILKVENDVEYAVIFARHASRIECAIKVFDDELADSGMEKTVEWLILQGVYSLFWMML